MKLFDFLIVPVRRSGGTAIQRFLSLHPNIIAIPKSGLDRALEGGQEDQLLESAQDAMQASPSTKFGLVQHKFVEVSEEAEDVARRLSRIVRKNGLVLIYRDYFDAMVSEHNHINIVHYCNYSFENAGLKWPTDLKLSGDMADLLHHYQNAVPNRVDGVEKIRGPEAFWEEHNRYLYYAKIQATYERHFNTPLVLDYNSIFDGTNPKSMQDIFRFVGVDASFSAPFFSTSQSGRIHRFLNHNRINISSDNFTDVQAALVSRNILDYAIDYPGTELAIRTDNYIEDDLKFSNGLSLAASSIPEFSSLGRKQQMLLRNDADRIMTEFMYPLWKHNYGSVSKVLDQMKIRTLSADFRRKTEQVLSSDMAQFFATNKHLATAWGR